MQRSTVYRTTAMVGATGVGLGTGGALALADAHEAADVVWAVTTGVAIVPAAYWVIDAIRRHRLGVDVVALLALVGALAVGEFLAGAVIATMLATGRALERWASYRADNELRMLLGRTPRVARRYEDGAIAKVPLARVRPGDRILVGPGEVVPVDGTLLSATAVLDESVLTGEALPVDHIEGEVIRSGVVNAGGPFDLRATTDAQDSTYAGIVRLVEGAQRAQSPFVRLADRYAAWFLLFTLALAGTAWAASADPVRAVAVLVVATPCPLILAAPVAIVSGLSRTAKRGLVVKSGAVLEQLARCHTLVIDKTGTLTLGTPTVSEVVSTGAIVPDEVLRLAACVEQVSPHVLAAAVVDAARRRNLTLELPTDVHEEPGQGVRGTVGTTEVAVGRARWISATPHSALLRAARRRAELDGALTVFVAVDGTPAGLLMLNDPVRPDAARTIRMLRASGIERVVLLSGDRADVAGSVGAMIGVDAVFAERSPADKVEIVAAEQADGAAVMVGDGINDAPALARAAVGIAIGARGATASSEAADAVLTVDRLARVGEAVAIARRTLAIGRESVFAGMTMSVVAMVAAWMGYLPPAMGAVLQEFIDVVVIVNALRALHPTAAEPQMSEADTRTLQQFRAEHRVIHADIAAVRAAADAIGELEPGQALARVRDLHDVLVHEVLPHEEAEDRVLYPAVSRVLGEGTTTAMSRGHVEIAHQIRRLGRLVDSIGPEGPDGTDLIELRQVLYGLYAILQFHTTQEDEDYLSLAEPEENEVGHEVVLR